MAEIAEVHLLKGRSDERKVVERLIGASEGYLAATHSPPPSPDKVASNIRKICAKLEQARAALEDPKYVLQYNDYISSAGTVKGENEWYGYEAYLIIRDLRNYQEWLEEAANGAESDAETLRKRLNKPIHKLIRPLASLYEDMIFDRKPDGISPLTKSGPLGFSAGMGRRR